MQTNSLHSACLVLAAPIQVTQTPRIESRIYPEHGYAILREQKDEQYWNGDGWCTFLNFGKSGVHGHQDRLSLMVFGSGALLTPDVESRSTAAHAFSSKVQRELNRSGLSQNTVMVDFREQKSIPRLLSLEDACLEAGKQTGFPANADGPGSPKGEKRPLRSHLRIRPTKQ